MTATNEFLDNNETYASGFSAGSLPMPPAKKIAVVACMDARLETGALLGIVEGDSHVIRNAALSTKPSPVDFAKSPRHRQIGEENWMFDRRRLVVRAVGILLMFAASSFALADDAHDYRSEVHDVIEEIVVVARKKSQRPNLGNKSDTYPAMQMPAWIDLQFLPRYDPEQADRYFDLIEHDEMVRRAGFIELFRLSFGR